MGDTLPIADVSGSGEGDPGCAISVAVIASYFNSPAWRDYILTFTTTPMVRLRYPESEKEYQATKGYGFSLPNGVEGGGGGPMR